MAASRHLSIDLRNSFNDIKKIFGQVLDMTLYNVVDSRVSSVRISKLSDGPLRTVNIDNHVPWRPSLAQCPRLFTRLSTVMSDQSTPNQVSAADQARCVLAGSRKINSYCNCSGVLVKLLVFTIMLGVIPIGSYFGTLDRMWNGMFLSAINLELLLNYTNG